MRIDSRLCAPGACAHGTTSTAASKKTAEQVSALRKLGTLPNRPRVGLGRGAREEGIPATDLWVIQSGVDAAAQPGNEENALAVDDRGPPIVVGFAKADRSAAVLRDDRVAFRKLQRDAVPATGTVVRTRVTRENGRRLLDHEVLVATGRGRSRPLQRFSVAWNATGFALPFGHENPGSLHVGRREVAIDDVTLFAEKLSGAKVPIILEVWDDRLHVFQMFPVLPDAERAIRRIGEFSGGALEPTASRSRATVSR